jgi:hypothetical protein
MALSKAAPDATSRFRAGCKVTLQRDLQNNRKRYL